MTHAPLLPKGTILRITSWYDNTTANKNNPDPNQWVGWGDRTVDEMGHAWINMTYMEDEDFKAEVEKRNAKLGTTTTAAERQEASNTRLLNKGVPNRHPLVVSPASQVPFLFLFSE